jgi:hypothetical protein
MDRNKLLKIIQRDLNELIELTDELAEKSQISTLEIEFALGKSRIISQEFDYLKEINQPLPLKPEIPEIKERKNSPVGPSSSNETIPERDEAGEPVAQIEKEDMTEDLEEQIVELEDTEQEAPVSAENETREEKIPIAVDAQKTVAEIFIPEKSVNDSLAINKTIDHKLADSPVTKLETAIGLNDRFQFIRELFNNDAGLFNRTVKHIDQMYRLDEAVTFLNSSFKWKKNETSMKFAQLVKRRFSN